MRKLCIVLLLIGGILEGSFAQTILSPQLENDLIWGSVELNEESPSSFSFLEDGRHFAQLENGYLLVYDIQSGERTDTLFSADDLNLENKIGPIRITDYSMGPKEEKILLQSLPEDIYRYSVKAEYIIYDRENGKAQYLDVRGKQMYPAFSPDGENIAYLWDNNLYIKDLSEDEITPVTQDGEWNKIINGGADWVYEEEFSLTKAFEWSPDGNYLAYIKFDESEVPQFDMKYYNDQAYPEKYNFKYPKVGQKLSDVNVYLFNTVTKLNKSLESPIAYDEYYIPRLKWMPDANQLIVYYLNRLQNHLQLINYDAFSGNYSTLLEEKNPHYLEVEVYDNLTFIAGTQQFLWTSEKSGWNQLYLYDHRGNELKKVTNDKFDLTEFYGYDGKSDRVYFQAAMKKPMLREVYAVNLETGITEVLEDSLGWNKATFSSTFDYYIHKYATINSPPVYTVKDRKGNKVRSLVENRVLQYYQKRYNVKQFEFLSFENAGGIELNAWMLKPFDFNPEKEYPLIMFVYGGPNSQEVINNWPGKYYWWFQMLAQNGYVVACVDNRGTGAKGEDFRKVTYGELGKYETEDQIDAAKYFREQAYIDSARIGIFGWSYGGYLSSLSLLKGNDVFSTAVAVAPVTNWKWYDAIYTERYMGLYSENEKGYNQNAPMFYADQLEGNYLLVHGLADDNVHFQHTAEMANALINNNKQFDTYFYPNRAHGISDLRARLHLFEKITSFLDENLKH